MTRVDERMRRRHPANPSTGDQAMLLRLGVACGCSDDHAIDLTAHVKQVAAVIAKARAQA